MPFDIVDLQEVREQIFAAAETRRQLVFATPNVSFAAQAQRDAVFREDVLRTNLSLPDGMPVIWLGRALGVPFEERVAGSDLLDSLIHSPGPRPLRVYFFGGDAGAAAAALQAVNARPGSGLIAVGASFPGYVPVDEMGTEVLLDDINSSQADLLVVALGAAKGHRWIEANRSRLQSPVISHLGAAINFVAGRLQRAPRILQRLGLEWLWRIKEEPALYKRYLRDGIFLLREGFVMLGTAARQRLQRRRTARVDIQRLADGELHATLSARFELDDVQRMQQAGTVTVVTLRQVAVFDPWSLGWLYANRYRTDAGASARIDYDAVSLAALQRAHAAPLLRAGKDRLIQPG